MNITIFKSVQRAYIDGTDQQIDCEWDDLAVMLSEHHVHDVKEQGLMFNLAQFKTYGDITAEPGRRKIYKHSEWTGEYEYFKGTVRRCKANVIGVDGIVLDVDASMTMEQIIDKLDGIEYILYTTFNHNINNHRFRVVIPFSVQLMAEDITGRRESIEETFPGVDHSSFTVSQSFYFHSGKQDSIVYHNTGWIVNPYSFEYRAPPVIAPITFEPSTINDDIANTYRKAVIESLLTCKNVRYRGDKFGGILMLVSICRSIGLEYEEYDVICQNIGGVDSTMQQADKRKTAWQDWRGNKITAVKRDKFIADHGGKPIVTYKSIVDKMENITFGER